MIQGRSYVMPASKLAVATCHPFFETSCHYGNLPMVWVNFQEFWDRDSHSGIIPVLRKLRQEDLKLKISLDYIVIFLGQPELQNKTLSEKQKQNKKNARIAAIDCKSS
jgi:hypothetical protein